MKTYVINLQRSEERRAHMERQLRERGLEFTFVKATDGTQLTTEERGWLVDEDAVARYPHWLRPGIIGCVLSHLATYRRIVEDGVECALVLEDDSTLPASTGDLLVALHPHLTMAEVALLHYRCQGPCALSEQAAVSLPGGRRLLYPMEVGPLAATTAYLITREACWRMIELVLPVRAGPDSWGFFLEHGALDRVRCVFPRPIGARTDFKSTVDYLGGPRSPLARLTTAISERRLFPLYQLLAFRRAIRVRQLSRFSIVSEPSPYAPSHAAGPRRASVGGS